MRILATLILFLLALTGPAEAISENIFKESITQVKVSNKRAKSLSVWPFGGRIVCASNVSA